MLSGAAMTWYLVHACIARVQAAMLTPGLDRIDGYLFHMRVLLRRR
jgi:hypothetical protein